MNRSQAVALEYRLVWEREGCKRRVKRYSTLAGAKRWALILQGRMAEATGLDPATYACCGAPQCWCGHKLLQAKAWSDRSEGIPPLVMGPIIEERVVGEWQESGSDT